MRSRMVRSIEEERVYGETGSDAIQGLRAKSPVRHAGATDGSPAVANGRLGGRPRARRLRTTTCPVPLGRRVNKRAAPVSDARSDFAKNGGHDVRDRPQRWRAG